METLAQPYFYLLSHVFYPPFLLASFTTTHPSMMCGIQSSVVNRRQVPSIINAVTNHNHQKSCWCTRFSWSNGNVKGVPCSDKPSENYQLTLQLLWALQDFKWHSANCTAMGIQFYCFGSLLCQGHTACAYLNVVGTSRPAVVRRHVVIGQRYC